MNYFDEQYRLGPPRRTECEITGEHAGDTYPVATIDGGTGWHWTCCDDIDQEAA